MMWKRMMVMVWMIGMWGMGGICPEHALAQGDKTGPIVSEIMIEIRDVPGDTAQLAGMARRFIRLREGEPFSPDKFHASLETLKASKMFRAINVPDPDWSKPEIILSFELTPFRRIKDIQIDGGFPLFEREILNAMTLYTGDVFTEKKLLQQKELIARLFADEGYISPEIEVKAEEDPADGHYIVYVDIRKGDFYRINQVRFKGNRAFSAARLRAGLQSWHASVLPGGMKRFVRKDLDEDVRKLTAFYRKKRYADVVIDPTVTKDDAARTVDILLNITEGPRYDISFEGNSEFWDLTLKKELTLFTKGNKNDFGLRKSIRNIRERYRQAGYAEVRIKPEEELTEKKGRAVRKIRLDIDEGPQSVVRGIEVAGNTAFDDEKIRKQLLTHTPGVISDGAFVPQTLEEDMGAVTSLYLKQGYMETGVTEELAHPEPEEKEPEEDKTYVTVRLNIEEGVQTRVADVTLKGLTVLPRAEALAVIALKPGEPFRQYMVSSDENTLSVLISEKGHPHVAVTGDVTFSPDRSQATVVYEVDEGPYVEMGEVFYSGNFRTRERVLEDEVELKRGDPFSLVRMLEAQRNIRNLSALDSARFKALGLEEKADTVDLLAEVEEKKPYVFQIGGGYDTERHFYVNTRIEDRNLFGLNKNAWASLEVSQIGYQGELGLTEPRFLGSRIGSTSNLFGEEREEFNQDFGTRTFGASQSFHRRFMKYFTANLSFRYEYREQYRTDDQPIPSEDADKYDPRSILVTTPSLVYNSTDSFVRPRKGMFASASVDISKGLENSLDDFFKYSFETRFYYTPLDRLTFALRGKYGSIEPFGSESNIPDDQLFFLGGTADVRGFDENRLRFDMSGDPVGGQQMILGSLEARYDLGMNFELATFYDIGSIRDAVDPGGDTGFRSTAGLGLRYITPIGPIGFLYGWKLDRKEGESSGKLHFTLGYTF